MINWTFDNDDRLLPEISNQVRNYAKDFQKYYREGKGLLLYGGVGTGKSYYAACIANKIMDDGWEVKMTNFAKIANSMQESFQERNRYIDELNRYDLLIIDDLGAERKSEYMNEIVFNVIDSRCRTGKPIIVTTNLKTEFIDDNQKIELKRIYDRLNEMCYPLEISCESRRTKKMKEEYKNLKMELRREVIENDFKGIPGRDTED